jgi:hypothetical protein
MTSKTEEVLKHLKIHGSITSLEAIELYGATRLSSIIFTLRKRGYAIDTERQGMVDRYGRAVNYGRYVLDVRKSAENMFGRREVEEPAAKEQDTYED